MTRHLFVDNSVKERDRELVRYPDKTGITKIKNFKEMEVALEVFKASL